MTRALPLAGICAVLALVLSGCATSKLQQFQAAEAADQDAAEAVAQDYPRDPDLERCTSVLQKMARHACPPLASTGAVGPGCLLAKAYVLTQAETHECAAVIANTKSSWQTILSAVGIIP